MRVLPLNIWLIFFFERSHPSLYGLRLPGLNLHYKGKMSNLNIQSAYPFWLCSVQNTVEVAEKSLLLYVSMFQRYVLSNHVLWFFSAQIFNPMLYVWTKSTKIDISLIFCPNPKPLYKQLSGSLSQKHPLTYDVLLVLSVWKDSQKISSVAPFSDLTQRTADAFQNVSLKEIMLEMLCYVLLSVSKQGSIFDIWIDAEMTLHLLFYSLLYSISPLRCLSGSLSQKWNFHPFMSGNSLSQSKPYILLISLFTQSWTERQNVFPVLYLKPQRILHITCDPLCSKNLRLVPDG